jgi:hypothetical protein
MSIYGEEYGQTIIPGELGSTALTQSQDNSGNTGSLGNANTGNGAFLGEGVRSGIDSWDKAYTNAGGTLPARFGLSDLKQFATDNKSWLAGAGALASVYGGGTNADKKTGYQGVIPTLSASRKMITAPPTRAQGYRPGAGGIDYGGDVTYALAPGQDPWANLSGTSGTAAGANTVPTGISNIVTGNTGVTGDTKVTGGMTQAEKDALAVANWRKSLSPQQYLSAINQWIADNPNMSKAELDAAMAKFKVTQTDLQTALGTNKSLSAADIYALTHGMGLKEANAQQTAGIQKFVKDNPYATAKQIADAIKASGVNTSEIKTGLAALNLSKGAQEALLSGMGLDAYYNNINKFLEDQKRDTTTPASLEELSRAAAKQSAGVSDADIAEAAKFLATDTGKKALEATYTPQLPKSTAGMTESDIFKLYDAQRDAGFTDAQLKEAAVKQYGAIKDEDWNYIKSQAGYAGGGEIAMAKGRYLQGETDGMADELPAQIGKSQPAALSHGEFVIPADVVSHMGNGNSDAGAKKLYQMMDKIRMARTGNKKQGKKINPDKFMPGGLAQAYASGGKVQHFQEGGAAKNYAAGLTGIESNLSNWAGPYVTNMLGQGQALANMPYQAYMGPLTSGESPLQTQAFNTAGTLTTPTSIGNAATTAGNIATKAADLTYKPTTSAFDATQAQTYMNPYLESSLKPQLEEARRQSQITQTQNAGKMTQAGAFGGGRQAILDAETQRSLGANLANITGQGYSTAYDKAMAQFNADQARKAQENQFGATYGLQGLQTGLQAAQAQGGLGATQASTGLANLNAQLSAGAQQRGIESEGIAADKAQFEEARANPYKMVQYQQSLLQGLPLAAQSYQGIEPSALLKASQGATTVNALLKNLGLI